ncbi:hypothetical protein Dimus_008715, partial [Dionaea muscipula]
QAHRESRTMAVGEHCSGWSTLVWRSAVVGNSEAASGGVVRAAWLSGWWREDGE